MKTKHKHPPPKPRPRWVRNDDGADGADVIDELLIPAPVNVGPAPGTPEASSMAMIPYNPAYAAAQLARRPAPLPRASLSRKAATVVRAKAAALKPNVVSNPLDKAHLLRVAAGASGGIAASFAAREFGDDLGERRLAIGLTVLGAAGTLFLDDHWQRVAAWRRSTSPTPRTPTCTT